MGSVLEFQQPSRLKSERYPSCPGLSDILTDVSALLSRVEALEIRTAEDLRQALFIIDLANTCIRLLIGQIKLNGTTKAKLLAQSRRSAQLMEATRRDAAHLF